LNWECSSTIPTAFSPAQRFGDLQSSSSPRISGCRFTGNQSTFRGLPFMQQFQSHIEIVCSKEQRPLAGAVSIEGASSPVILRSVFQGNVGNGGGGALHNSGWLCIWKAVSLPTMNPTITRRPFTTTGQ